MKKFFNQVVLANTMKIEQFSIEMYDEVYNIWKKTELSLGSSDTKEQIQRASDYCKDLFLVGKEEDKIVAVVMGAYDGRRGYVHHLAVDPEFHRKGYGKQIMLELHERFKNKDVKKVF